MTALERAVAEVLARSERGSMNESNTKVLLVEPILEALGWDTKDLDCMTRETQGLRWHLPGLRPDRRLDTFPVRGG